MRSFNRSFLVILVLALFAGSVSLAADAPKWIGAFYVKGKIGLKWKKVEGVSEFNVYRKVADGEFEKIVTTDKTQYFDTELTFGVRNTYKIASVGADGSEAIGAEKTVDIPASTAGSFKPPTWSGVRIDRKKIFLNWDRVPGVMAYNVYRATVSGGDFEVVGNSTGNRYVDEGDLEKGNTYYYVITALNEEFEETEFSEERSVQYGKSAEEEAALAKAMEVKLEDVTRTLLFTLEEGGASGKLNQPADCYIDGAGNVYVTDPFNGRVIAYDAQGKFLRQIGEKADQSKWSDPSDGTMANPSFIAGDDNGNLYVCDPKMHLIHVFKTNGDFVKWVGTDIPDGNKPFNPNGIYVLKDGRIIVSDTPNHRYFLLDNDGNIIKQFGKQGEGVGELNFPGGITVIGDSLICLVDIMNARIQQFDLEGNPVHAFGEVGSGPGYFGRPNGICYDNGKIWVADLMLSVIQGFSVKGEVKHAFNEFVAAGVKLSGPTNIHIRDNKMYIVNALENQVLVVQL